MGESVYPSLGQVSDLEEYLGSSTPNAEGLLQRLLDAASQDLQSDVGRQMAGIVDYSETRVVPASRIISLRNPPVESLTSVALVPSGTYPTLNTQPINVSATPNEAYAYILDNQLHLPWAVPVGLKVTISYTGGFSVVPADFYQAVLELAALRFKARSHIGEDGKTLAGETVHYNFSKKRNDFIKDIVQRYRVKVYD